MKCSARPRGVRGASGGRRKSVDTPTRRDFSRSMWMIKIAGIASRPSRPQGLAKKVGIVRLESVMFLSTKDTKDTKRPEGNKANELHELKRRGRKPMGLPPAAIRFHSRNSLANI